jgi:hypothetical protein
MAWFDVRVVGGPPVVLERLWQRAAMRIDEAFERELDDLTRKLDSARIAVEFGPRKTRLEQMHV